MSILSNHQKGAPAAFAGADWLCLAAAPVFAVMALLTAMTGGADMICCSSSEGTWPLNGMAMMYLLMSVFHAAPWIRLVSNRRP